MINLPSGYKVAPDGPVFRNLSEQVLRNTYDIQALGGSSDIMQAEVMEPDINRTVNPSEIDYEISVGQYHDGKRTASHVTVEIPACNTLEAGLMTAADKTRLEKCPVARAHTVSDMAITEIVTCTADEYLVLSPIATTLYVIVG